jgi:hypothetical protein
VIDEVRSELSFKVAHRDVVEVMRPAEAYALKFAAETEALKSLTTFFGKKSLMKQRHSVVRPGASARNAGFFKGTVVEQAVADELGLERASPTATT